ncbi:DUF3597 domain-containing protein [Terricaulis sp.]|uniref:DUF3597 domain-containing protein n=1 Tax=Terricaulis sp. TaxID=2768686 RepID=UPI002AC3971A|nr:DUF3597 domain-containing protein [Terricaulis sp.]MDZ4690270.1 DUF3597 domain-containing protein [Terricaulis sp.]
MGIFSTIWDRITVDDAERREHRERRERPNGPAQPQATPRPTTAAPVDVEAVLEQKASAAGGGGNWRTSIVDLLKLLDIDSGLDARKELASELNVHAGAHGSAEQNIALSKAVWKKLADNGGRVPASLKD